MHVSLCLFSLLLVLIVAPCFAQRINQAELNDRSLVQKRLNCLLDKGPCDRTGSRLKAALPEVLKYNCRKCTPEQKNSSQILIKFAQQRYPKEWASIKAKYSG